MENISTLSIDARAIPPLALFTAKNDIRYFLEGICVFPHPERGAYVVATNGHCLAMWHDANGTADKQRIIRVTKGLVDAAKNGRRLGDRRLTIENDRIAIVEIVDGTKVNEVFIQEGPAEIDAKYPDVWRAIPDDSGFVPGLFGNIDSRYVATIGRAARRAFKACCVPYCGVSFFSSGSNGRGHVIARLSEIDELVMLVMPMAINAVPLLPSRFVRPKKAEEPSAEPEAGKPAGE